MNKKYHETNIHKRALIDIALNVELLLNMNDRNISEYDIQAFMYKFFKTNLLNTKYTMCREIFGKYDCAISDYTRSVPSVLYEIKTFVKPKEKFPTKSALKKIIKDFKKLYKNKYDNVRCYFVLVIKKQDIKKANELEGFEWFKLREESNKKEYKFESYKIRPSAKEIILNTCVYSWEIKKLPRTSI